ncbi:uncharacterized protein LOC127762651 [Oryza glaberrima]|uniref:uncharacterized protein LOC127762651 n=1 Tax=Oryza glaberrima TaxID=4538 RepID=UPI00224BEA90|nr:uncharacterized protein LOC127762651 [Oryza glaberrima]
MPLPVRSGLPPGGLRNTARMPAADDACWWDFCSGGQPDEFRPSGGPTPARCVPHVAAVAAASCCSLYSAAPAPAVVTAIFQGATALLAFTQAGDFLAELRSYVREEDGEVILKLVGGLGAAIFVLEWAALRRPPAIQRCSRSAARTTGACATL